MTAKLISAFVFAIRIVQSLFYLNPKFQASSHLLWLYSPVCVGPGRKPQRPVFSQRGSFVFCSLRSASKRKDDDYKPVVESDDDNDDDQHSEDSYSVSKKTRTPKSVSRRPSTRTPTSSKKPKVLYGLRLEKNCFRPSKTQTSLGEGTGLVVRASDSESGDPGSILGWVGVLFP